MPRTRSKVTRCPDFVDELPEDVWDRIIVCMLRQHDVYQIVLLAGLNHFMKKRMDRCRKFVDPFRLRWRASEGLDLNESTRTVTLRRSMASVSGWGFWTTNGVFGRFERHGSNWRRRKRGQVEHEVDVWMHADLTTGKLHYSINGGDLQYLPLSCADIEPPLRIWAVLHDDSGEFAQSSSRWCGLAFKTRLCNIRDPAAHAALPHALR